MDSANTPREKLGTLQWLKKMFRMQGDDVGLSEIAAGEKFTGRDGVWLGYASFIHHVHLMRTGARIVPLLRKAEYIS